MIALKEDICANPSFEINPEYQKIIDGLEKKIIPERYPEIEASPFSPVELSLALLFMREKIINLSGYALVSYDWIGPLANWIGSKKCLEIMCGSGILSKALQDCGVDIIATDDYSWPDGENWFLHPWTTIEKIDCIEAIEKYGNIVDIIICSWPYRDNTASRALLKMRQTNTELLMIYIGEYGKATADEAFFATACKVEDYGFKGAVANFKQWLSIHDYPVLFK